MGLGLKLGLELALTPPVPYPHYSKPNNVCVELRVQFGIEISFLIWISVRINFGFRTKIRVNVFVLFCFYSRQNMYTGMCV